MIRRSLLKSAGALAMAAPSVLSGALPAIANPQDGGPGLDITWLGGATLLMTCGDLTLLTDPAFGEGDRAFRMGNPNTTFDLAKGPDIVFHKRHTPFPGVDLATVDHVLISHLHEDHFDQEAERTIPKTMPFLVPGHDRAKLAAKGFSNLRQADWGETHVLRKGNVSVMVTAIPAEHSQNPEIARILGPGNGYWLTFKQSDWKKTVYWTGDTFPTARVLEAVEPFGSPDIFIPHLGGVGTTGPLGQISMGAVHASDFVDRLQPEKILPVHHSTYALYLEPVAGLPAVLESRTRGLDLISEGTRLRYI